jgi:hypothetical protein
MSKDDLNGYLNNLKLRSGVVGLFKKRLKLPDQAASKKDLKDSKDSNDSKDLAVYNAFILYIKSNYVL